MSSDIPFLNDEKIPQENVNDVHLLMCVRIIGKILLASWEKASKLISHTHTHT